MEKIVTEYSLWYIPVCLALGLIYASVLYFRNKKDEFSPVLRWILTFLRGIVVAIIAFLLLNPLIRSVQKHNEKPVILLLQDNSASVALGKDSAFYRTGYLEYLNKLIADVDQEFSVVPYSFGEDLYDLKSTDYKEQQTNFSKAFENIHTRYSHRNVGAMVVLSDGINNRGVNPLYSGLDLNFPIYTVALGDTSVHRDLILSKINYNRIAYLGNEFPLEVIVNAKKSTGRSSVITIERNGNELFRKTVSFSSENDIQTIQTSLEPEDEGLQRYTVTLSPLADELSFENNTMDFFIDVLKDKQKILLLANAPHPDISAIKQSINENVNYQLEDFIISDFNTSVNGYNLVILHGLPSIRHNITSVLTTIKDENIPVLFFVTKKTFLPIFNEQQTGISILPDNLIYNEALPSVNNNFGYFNLSDKTTKTIESYPPLISPYGNIQVNPSATSLAFQRIGTVTTDKPMIIFNRTIDRKSGVVLGSGIWRWRIHNYSENSDHNSFNEIVSKTVQYLSLKADKSLFRVYCNNNFEDSEDIEFEAELYNDVYELVNDADLAITITGSDGTNYPFSFSKTSDAYYLNAGNLPEGAYSYSARLNSNGKVLSETGEFTVSSRKLEMINTIADHNLLFSLAEKHGGKMYYPGEMDQLGNAIKSREDIRTINYYQKRFSELLNLPLIFAFILLLLSVEWFLRKRAGGY